jgi:hypothetical protein
MKELTLTVVAVLCLALVLGLAFHLLYPRVEITAELAGLIVFVALVLKLAFSKLWSMKKKAGP